MHVLDPWLKEGAYLNITLNHVLETSRDLSASDKAFVTRMVYGVAQNKLFLDFAIKQNLKGRVKRWEKTLLYCGLYVHYFMTMKDYAIVNECVRLAKKRKGAKTAGFINASLRTLFEEDADLSSLSKEEELSVRTSHPLWIVKMFAAQYGFDTCQKICEANQDVPPLTGCVNRLKTTRDALMQADPRFTAGTLSPDAVMFGGGAMVRTDAWTNGLVSVQDEAAQLPAQLLNPQPGEQVLDMCAAPGSKTAQLAAMMKNTGSLTACDIHDHKKALMEDNFNRLGVTNVHIQIGDSSLRENFGDELYDAILLDAPCTGLGVLGRKPDIRYHDSAVMDEIIPLQKKLLENAYALLKNHGRIVYSTCSLNKKENEKQVEAFLTRHQDCTLVRSQTILPFEHHTDGFYMGLIRKDTGE